MSGFKPFDGMQKPPEGPPPSQEALRLKDALKRTIAEVRKLEGQVQTLEAEKLKANKKIAVLQTSLQSSQRCSRGDLGVPASAARAAAAAQHQPQQWPPRPSQKRRPEEPGLRVTRLEGPHKIHPDH